MDGMGINGYVILANQWMQTSKTTKARTPSKRSTAPSSQSFAPAMHWFPSACKLPCLSSSWVTSLSSFLFFSVSYIANHGNSPWKYPHITQWGPSIKEPQQAFTPNQLKHVQTQPLHSITAHPIHFSKANGPHAARCKANELWQAWNIITPAVCNLNSYLPILNELGH